MKIAISGPTGFIGTQLVRALSNKGHAVVPIGRREFNRGTRHLSMLLKGCDAVINLAGAPINRRWTLAYKRTIVSSRVETTRMLVSAVSQMRKSPKTFISTSGMGAFDTKGRYTENDVANAADFLGELTFDWESAAWEGETLVMRVVVFRLSLVLGQQGGLMGQVLTPFRLGLGGPIASGKQHFSWIHIDDLINAYLLALDNPRCRGIYHLAAPNPVNNLEFTRTLGKALNRPTLFRVPATLLKLAYGEGAEVMTSGQCIVSERLEEAGFKFRHVELESAIQAIVKSSTGSFSFNDFVDSRG
ncbi:MAG: TIGR01777 family oxidoreductase [Candidatus Thiodiazotropha sp. (ex Ctena orbiculata)]|nr:TIGR01777 family oxidoreductase [Candidatus Thiodiazotropha taylori]MBT2998726.1 TIGR01777 family oxidoreductase [Candidatus Thiodiazotropha taylori]MBT3002357.1 TIGR01777 family oxidoreductase [Candidatus Thiodiazotropha taylori]MBV2108821.1 TIGR01777 family oxidoreductase [Candidatus Thiodiazotropha taylori]MBV2113179.1 TIGR01777 family oxidoreductase [Candidatus Thiodiazotropha taylori]